MREIALTDQSLLRRFFSVLEMRRDRTNIMFLKDES